MYKSHEGEVQESVQDVIRWQILFFWLWYALCRPSDLNSDSAVTDLAWNDLAPTRSLSKGSHRHVRSQPVNRGTVYRP